MAYSKSDKYPFLNERLAKEGHVEEILAEIELLQKNWLRNRSGELATPEYLNESRNVKMPLTQKRLMNIQFLVDQLIKNHPEHVRPVYSFNFSIEPETKKLTIEEKIELTLMLNDSAFHALQSMRDSNSTSNLLQLLQSFRLFNLTKLIKKTKNRNQLSQIVKNQLGKSIFTFKNFAYDRSGMEITEDFCFHKNNYEAVKNKIEVETLKKIIEMHAIPISRRLKNLGILNPYISDYRDSKIDYILSILTGELAAALDKKDLITVKNFNSLRNCINKVDKILDPVILLDADIMNHIKSHFMTSDRDILALFKDLTPELFNRWETEKTGSGKILSFPASDGSKYIIDPSQFFTRYDELMHLILYGQEFRYIEQRKKDEKLFTADLLTDAGKKILSSKDLSLKVFGDEENINSFKKMAKDYEDYKTAEEETEDYYEETEKDKGKSFFAVIISGIASLFTRGGKTPAKVSQKSQPQKAVKIKKGISRETRDIYKLIRERKAPLIPLSDMIELKPENEMKIEQTIKELRENELKIVVPIYNARQVLYPLRSKKYLMADVEYLMIDIDAAKSPESIREYIDQITGFKFKEDVISGNALFSIEKYLFSINRQNKAKKRREKK
ncbi:MAG TPA: hypothetical protein PK358_03795 [Spirochaetota bacterium]|mgnify:CR=1 FL=1|nr:hypothetical protein [Spirochaetota bacterium]HPJ33930.1 hypothetical protein [Spirochaetota bacterium]